MGSPTYTEEEVELAERENYTFSIKREHLDPSDKEIYVIVKALSPNESDSQVSFETLKIDLPTPQPDYS